MVGAHVRSRAGEGSFGCSLLGVFLQPRYQFMSAAPLAGCGSWPGRTALCAHAVLALSWSSWPGLVGARGVGGGAGLGLAGVSL